MNPAKRREIFLRLQAANPHPTTELEYSTPFELLVAVMLSAQATDKSVNLATRELFPVANTPQKLLDLGEENLREYVQRIGLYQTKSKHLIQTCRILLAQHKGQVPQTREELEAMPGVGRSGKEAAQSRTGRIQTRRTSLADPARTLCVSGAQTSMQRMHYS